MTAPNPNPQDANAVLDEAALWIEKRDREIWSTADQAALENWLAASPANLVAFLRAESVWARADRLSASRAQSRDQMPVSQHRDWRKIGQRSAALLVLAAGLAAAGFMLTPRSSEQRYETPVGGRTILSLADGSKIELNTDTAIRIANTSTRRMVMLDKGEAFFDVKHDANRPFVVLAANHRITDIGTKFLVHERGDDLEVSLVEGRASIETSESSVSPRKAVLTRGDVARATPTSLSVQKSPPKNLSRALAWRRGVLVFDNTTLSDAAAEFNRYNAHKLLIADAAAGRLTVVGTFHTDDVQAFAEVAEDILHLRVKTNDQETVISR